MSTPRNLPSARGQRLGPAGSQWRVLIGKAGGVAHVSDQKLRVPDKARHGPTKRRSTEVAKVNVVRGQNGLLKGSRGMYRILNVALPSPFILLTQGRNDAFARAVTSQGLGHIQHIAPEGHEHKAAQTQRSRLHRRRRPIQEVSQAYSRAAALQELPELRPW